MYLVMMSMSHGSTHHMKFESRSAADVTDPTDGEAWRAIPAAQRGQMLCLSRRLDEKAGRHAKKLQVVSLVSKFGNLGCGWLVCHMKGYERI